MLRIQVYPVLDGIELWIAGQCRGNTLDVFGEVVRDGHDDHRGEQASIYVAGDEVDARGPEGAIAHALHMVLVDNEQLARRALC